MRIRSTKPEFWRSDDIAALALEDRLLFIGPDMRAGEPRDTPCLILTITEIGDRP